MQPTGSKHFFPPVLSAYIYAGETQKSIRIINDTNVCWLFITQERDGITAFLYRFK
jgi:hypothetical protein